MSVSHNLVTGAIVVACLGIGATFAVAGAGNQPEPVYALSVWSREDFQVQRDPTFGPHVGTKEEVDRAALLARKQNPKRTSPEKDAVIFACKMQTRHNGLHDPSPPLTEAELKRDCTEY